MEGILGPEMGAVIIAHWHSAKFERLRLPGVDERGFETSLELEELSLPEPFQKVPPRQNVYGTRRIIKCFGHLIE